MKDRVPTKPNRYAVYDDTHTFLRYEYHERADDPTQVGDALNKANLLKDATAALYGLGAGAVPNDVFALIKPLLDNSKVVTGSYVGAGTYGVNNKNSINLGFIPSFIIVQTSAGGAFWATKNVPSLKWLVDGGGSGMWSDLTFIWSTIFSWYSTDIIKQCNESGKTYYYTAIK